MTTERKGHVVRDLSSRRDKALKIERILGLKQGATSLRMLEIGCGSGGISHYFGTHLTLDIEVDAVDVRDSRSVIDSYRFQEVSDTKLPFEGGRFDIVLTNHVIEHVGERPEQMDHLREIFRVLNDDGVCYLAVPNRWMLVEPHYRLAFLSWLPVKMRSGYLRMRGRGAFYDCVPLQMTELEGMLKECGFVYRNVCVSALYETLAIERPRGFMMRVLNRMPSAWLDHFRALIPTLIYVLRKS